MHMLSEASREEVIVLSAEHYKPILGEGILLVSMIVPSHLENCAALYLSWPLECCLYSLFSEYFRVYRGR